MPSSVSARSCANSGCDNVDTSPGGRGCVLVLEPPPHRCPGELVHGFVESEVHGGFEQAEDSFGVGRQFMMEP